MQPADQKYVTCNADEGDSGTFADRMLMEGDPFVPHRGHDDRRPSRSARPRATSTCASSIRTRIAPLNEAIAAAYARGYLGANVLGSGKRFDLEVRLGAGAYICGEETSMLESLEGKRGEVRPRPPLPAIKGLFGQPTIVNNVISLASVPIILDKGARVLSRLRHGQVARHAADPARRQHQARRPDREGVRRHAARAAVRLRRRQRLRPADPRGAGRAARSAPTCRSRSSTRRSTTRRSPPSARCVGHGGIVVFDDTVDMAQMARYAMEFCAIESCGKCTPCRIGSTRGVEVIDRVAAGRTGTATCACSTNLCETMLQWLAVRSRRHDAAIRCRARCNISARIS